MTMGDSLDHKDRIADNAPSQTPEEEPMSVMSTTGSPGWQTGKFVVQHYRRGDLLDGEAFVLVPERDPAAIVAIRAYAQATPNADLGQRLLDWVDFIAGDEPVTTTVDDRLPSWIATIGAKVESGEIDITTALFRLAVLVGAQRELP